METRRNFLKKTAIGSGAIVIGGLGFSAKSYGNILGSNDRIRVGLLGFSNRFKDSLGPSFLKYAASMNFEFVAVGDIWNRRRQEGFDWMKAKTGNNVFLAIGAVALLE